MAQEGDARVCTVMCLARVEAASCRRVEGHGRETRMSDLSRPYSDPKSNDRSSRPAQVCRSFNIATAMAVWQVAMAGVGWEVDCCM